MNDTPTPRTDAAWSEAYNSDFRAAAFAMTRFARDLERQLAEATAWRPIEEAPKDGTHILAALKWRDEYTQTVIYWNGRYWQLVEAGGYATDADPDGTPTHWQPLPNPPTV